MMTGFTIFDWAGMFGVGLTIAAYALLQLGLIRGTGSIFPALNLAGALLILVGLTNTHDGDDISREVIWAAISVVGLVRVFFLHNRLFFTDEEQAVLSYALPHMSHPNARMLLDRGIWFDADAGTVLMREDEEVDRLLFLLDGSATLTSEGRAIGSQTCGLIGEAQVLNGEPATATVTLDTPARIFTLSRGALRNLMHRDEKLGSILPQHLADATKYKLTKLA